MDSCAVCGSSEFEEIDAFYYCAICQTQKVGATIEVRDDEAWASGVALRVVGRELEDKTADGGVPWTSTEGFNSIIIHWCRALEESLNLGPDFRAVVLGLWATYLARCESAFVDGQEGPKLNLSSKIRDIQIIKQGLEKVENSPCCSKLKLNPWKTIGNLRIKRKFVEIKSKNSIPISTKYSADVEKKRSQKERKNTNGFETEALDGIQGLLKTKENDETHMDLDEDSLTDDDLCDDKEAEQRNLDEGYDIFPEHLLPRPKVKNRRAFRYICCQVNKVLNQLDEESDSEKAFENEAHTPLFINDKKPSEEETIQRSEDDKFYSKRARILRKITNYDEKVIAQLYRTGSIVTYDRMAMLKIIVLFQIAFRILNLCYYGCDLLHWIKQGLLPYFDAYQTFPKEWILFFRTDSNIFHPNILPIPMNLDSNISRMLKFLKVKKLPCPNLNDLLKRFLIDLNLPLGLEPYVKEKLKLIKRNPPHAPTLLCGYTYPAYECYVFAAIVVTLRTFFLLDGELETAIIDKIGRSYPGAFNLGEWITHTKESWKAIQLHYLPIDRKIHPMNFDGDVLVNYYEKISNRFVGNEKFKLKTIRSIGVTIEFHNEMTRTMLFLRNHSDIPNICMPKEMDTYHFKNAKDFARVRMRSLGKDVSILEKQFSDQSVEYLSSIKIFDEKLTRKKLPKITGNSLSGRAWVKILEKWPHPLQIFLEIGSFILGRTVADVAMKIFWMDYASFNKVYGLDRPVKRNRKKARR